MDDRQRAETGEYVETVTPEKVLDALESIAAPVATAAEVGEEIGCTGQAARKKLNQLHETGDVERKSVGARAVVWWLPESDSDAEGTPHEQAFEDFAARVTDQWPDEIEQIILYGSTARGEAHGIDSDVDVMLVTPTDQARETVYDPATSISLDVMIEHGVALSLNFKTVSELEELQDRAYVKNALQEGRVYG
jgi:predicted nucleotidyltransferase